MPKTLCPSQIILDILVLELRTPRRTAARWAFWLLGRAGIGQGADGLLIAAGHPVVHSPLFLVMRFYLTYKAAFPADEKIPQLGAWTSPRNGRRHRAVQLMVLEAAPANTVVALDLSENN